MASLIDPSFVTIGSTVVFVSSDRPPAWAFYQERAVLVDDLTDRARDGASADERLPRFTAGRFVSRWPLLHGQGGLVLDRIDAKEAAWPECHVPQMPDVGSDVDLHRLAVGNIDSKLRAGHP